MSVPHRQCFPHVYAISSQKMPLLYYHFFSCHFFASLLDLPVLSIQIFRYGSPGNTLPEYKKWSEWYLKTFTKGILDTVLKVLSVYATEGSYVSPRVVQLALNYVNNAVSHALSYKILKPNVPTLVKEVIFRSVARFSPLF